MGITPWKAGEALATTTPMESQAMLPCSSPRAGLTRALSPPQGHAGAQGSQDRHTEGAPCPREAVSPLQGQVIQGSRLKAQGAAPPG